MGPERPAIRYKILRARPDEEGERLDVALARRLGKSRTAVRQGLCTEVLDCEGRRMKWSRRLRAGERFQLPALTRPEPDVEVRFEVLIQDRHLVAVDKGPGAPVHPSRSWRSRTVLTRLRDELAEPTLKPLHRLDRETSGVLLFGRTPEAMSSVLAQFRAGQVAKRYLAIVRGEPGFDQVTVDAPLARDPDFPVRCRMRVDPIRGRVSHTALSVVRRFGGRALVRAEPRTGRQHQIRVHLAHLGYPLLGDKLYQESGQPYLDMIRDELDGEDIQRLGHERHALHAERIEFIHPGTGHVCRVEAPLAADLTGLLS